MAMSYNGWAAPPPVHTVLTINGVSFLPYVRAGDVAVVLGYVAQQVNDRVEKIHSPGCWGYSYRKNRNANNLSNHASGTAIDFNAPLHPNGVKTSRTFSLREIIAIHTILSEVLGTVRWGGDYHGVPDSMHFEIDASAARVKVVADQIRHKTLPAIVARQPQPQEDDDMTPDQLKAVLRDAPMPILVGPDKKLTDVPLGLVIQDLEQQGDDNTARLVAMEKKLDALTKLLQTAVSSGKSASHGS